MTGNESKKGEWDHRFRLKSWHLTASKTVNNYNFLYSFISSDLKIYHYLFVALFWHFTCHVVLFPSFLPFFNYFCLAPWLQRSLQLQFRRSHISAYLLCRSGPVDLLQVTRSLRWQRESPPNRPEPGHSILDHLSQHCSRLSFSMENRSFDNAGPAPQPQGESSIILLLARKSHLAGSFSPNHFHEIYLG
jgi:hypothetical protein